MLDKLMQLRRALDILNLTASWIAAIGILFACISITWAVVGRGVFGANTIWELEASVYILIYAAFLGLSYSDRSGSQIAIDVIRSRITGKASLIYRSALDLIALCLFSLVFWSSWNMFYNAWTTGWTSMSLWGPPLWIPYLAIPIGTAMIIPNLILDILIRMHGQSAPADSMTGEH